MQLHEAAAVHLCECECGKPTPVRKDGKLSRYLIGHNPNSRRPVTALSERFWKKIGKDGPTPEHRPELGPCWTWSDAPDINGYGHIGRGGRRTGNGMMYAHRASWEIHFGPIPENLDVCHHCDNPPCTNPLHLFVGTAQDNLGDMAVKGRSTRGERDGMAKITEAQVREIRDLSISGFSYAQICQRYGLTRSYIGAIVRRKRWPHVL